MIIIAVVFALTWDWADPGALDVCWLQRPLELESAAGGLQVVLEAGGPRCRWRVRALPCWRKPSAPSVQCLLRAAPLPGDGCPGRLLDRLIACQPHLAALASAWMLSWLPAALFQRQAEMRRAESPRECKSAIGGEECKFKIRRRRDAACHVRPQRPASLARASLAINQWWLLACSSRWGPRATAAQTRAPGHSFRLPSPHPPTTSHASREQAATTTITSRNSYLWPQWETCIDSLDTETVQARAATGRAQEAILQSAHGCFLEMPRLGLMVRCNLGATASTPSRARPSLPAFQAFHFEAQPAQSAHRGSASPDGSCPSALAHGRQSTPPLALAPGGVHG